MGILSSCLHRYHVAFHSLADEKCAGSIPLEIPLRNKIVWPRRNYEFVQLLRGWQELCQTDSFIFDYHFGHAIDFFGGDIGKVLWRDLHDLEEIGLKGINSCQTLRAFYPSGIPMAILAETTWNNRVTLEEIRDRYLKAAFGEDAPFVSEYLNKIDSFFDPAENYEHSDTILTAERDKPQELLKFVRENRSRLERIAEKQRGMAQNKSAFYLLHHNRYVILILEAAILYSKGEKEKALAKVDETLKHFLSTEDEILKAADVFYISRSLDRLKARMKLSIL